MTRSFGLAAGCLAAALSAAACAALQPSYRDDSVRLETEARVDLDRYLGLWYEIARYPNSFEQGCEGVTAEYTRRDDGLIGVRNTCRRPEASEPIEVADGRARVVDGSNGSKLEVSFAPAWIPFAWGDYWILDVDAEYQTALVGSPDGANLWILARTPAIDEATRQRLEQVAQQNGFDPDRLQDTLQPPRAAVQ
jgi:apolipoprotein D and lipocalin family protein